MAKAPEKQKAPRREPYKKKTSIGTRGRPLNKHKRRATKPYRGQG